MQTTKIDYQNNPEYRRSVNSPYTGSHRKPSSQSVEFSEYAATRASGRRGWRTVALSCGLILSLMGCVNDDPSEQMQYSQGECSAASSEAACTDDNDCQVGEACEDGTCIVHECDDQTDSEHPVGNECGVDADCAAGQECEHGFCVSDTDTGEDEHPVGNECGVDADCAAGQECEHGLCVADNG